MVRNTEKRVLAGLLILVATGAIFAQTPASQRIDFSLRSTDGQTVTTTSLHGEIVVLAFGASWLPLSKTQLQGVRKLADDYSSRGVVVYWVSTESDDPKSKNFASDEQLRSFSQKYGLKVTVLRDPDGVVSKKFGVDQLPSIVILDKEGNVSGGPIGGLDPSGNLAGQLASRLDKLL
ncbi:MAG TPA: TlpA disulfide reductase family protein [Pyrinomonadaceae bacterium]|jgi:peroxiredoxin|nr:TlpA disulfide reductase family protein [Pyrinomonadaceae bacterium]